MKISKYILVPVVGFFASLLISCDVSDNPVEPVKPVDPVDPVVRISSLEIKADGLDNGKMTLVVGESVQLSSVIYPANASDVRVKWKSSDENVVTVSETGLMTTVNSGTATVTLQSVANPEIKATVEVRVTDGTIDVNNEPVDQSLAEARG